MFTDFCQAPGCNNREAGSGKRKELRADRRHGSVGRYRSFGSVSF